MKNVVSWNLGTVKKALIYEYVYKCNYIFFIIILQSKMIESGEYVLGETIVPQTYKKVVLAEDDTIKTEFFTVSGRKIPLSD